ncbi:uncharacterized protein LOC132733324 [Ruditapes philippinarum]|uniref:uncharacterized protein LOC132733324 n=1 Tax=Ruditapes philippinarum TaxID=129788 RepID=UPI00295A642D|nr:uncharacterized protein LOC132733324 [Ruditapes philippinarum]
MDVLKIFFLVMLWQVDRVDAQEILSERKNTLRSIEELIVYIKLGKDEVCAGVQMSDAWVLTLADCIDTKIKLGKYSITYQDGSKQVIAEDRDSVGEEFVLLRIKPTKETKTKFAKLSNLMLPSPDYDYRVYSKDESDKVTANDVVFVRGIQCVKKGIEGNFGETHKCLRVNIAKTTKCFPGNPIFGSKENKVMLQGLTVASSDSCSSSLYSYAVIKPQVSWINTVILDCGSVENIQNGKIIVDKKSKTSVGATATIKCDNGYLASRQKIFCLNTGKWQKSICEIKDCGRVKKIVHGTVVLDKTKTSTYGATATVKCSPGYRPNQEKIVCLDTGKWEPARCKIKGMPKSRAEVQKAYRQRLKEKNNDLYLAKERLRRKQSYTPSHLLSNKERDARNKKNRDYLKVFRNKERQAEELARNQHEQQPATPGTSGYESGQSNSRLVVNMNFPNRRNGPRMRISKELKRAKKELDKMRENYETLNRKYRSTMRSMQRLKRKAEASPNTPRSKAARMLK